MTTTSTSTSRTTDEQQDAGRRRTTTMVTPDRTATSRFRAPADQREGVRTLWAHSVIATVSLLILLAAGAAMFERPDAFDMMMNLFWAYTTFSGVVTGFYFKSQKKNTNQNDISGS